MRNLILALFVLFFVTACAPKPPAPPKASFEKVELGMTEEQVKGILGQPPSVYTHPQDKALQAWEYSEKDWVNFADGKVFEVACEDMVIKDAAAPTSASSPVPALIPGAATKVAPATSTAIVAPAAPVAPATPKTP